MISVCCCAINSKFEVDTFVRAIAAQCKNVEFEIILTHDDRVNDGSGKYFKSLQDEVPQLKVIHHSNQDTIDYLDKLLAYYRKKGLFSNEVIDALDANLTRYKLGDTEFVDPTKTFLWISSGPLYNKAVAASTGDILVITPADFIYLFSLDTLDKFVKANVRNGHLYSAPHALWSRISNQSLSWIEECLQQTHSGERAREGFRWDSPEPFRDFLKFSTDLTKIYVPNFKKPELVPLGDPDFQVKMSEYLKETMGHPGTQQIMSFHGFHIMTRKTFETIGGFTEEFYGRAFADDKMTYLGVRSPNAIQAPSDLTVAWCGCYELSACQAEYYPSNWKEQLPLIDSYYDKHPLPPSINPTYLHEGLFGNNTTVHEFMRKILSPMGSPIRVL